MSEELIAWVDVEATGLEPDNDSLLEVACLITDTDLNILDPEGYHAVVYYPSVYVEMMKTQTDPYVINMHTETKLWDKLPDGLCLPDIDAELLAYAKKFAPEPRTLWLGGNSITLDRNFLNRYLPGFGQHLYYRSIDVTGVAKLAQWWQNPDMKYRKEYRHAALDDIRESIAELAYLREQWLGKPVDSATPIKQFATN